MRARYRLWITAVVIVAAACDGGGGGTTTRPSAPSHLVAPLGAFCDLLDRCPELYAIGARDRNECIDILYWLFTCQVVADGVQRVELPLDEAGGAACARALDGLSCEDLGCFEEGACPELEACVGLGAGFGAGDDDDALAEGERCYGPGSSEVCGAGLFCASERYDAATESVICSVCAPLLADGAACDPRREDAQCAAGLGCIAADDQRTRAACGPLRGDGATCRGDQECADGFCTGEALPFVCRAGGRIGDPCTVRNDCRWDQLGADYVTCVSGTCAMPLAPGDPCTSDDACRSFHCDPSDSRCGAPEGGACASDYECRAGFCDNRMCAPLRASGMVCNYDGMCASTYCDPSAGRCATAPQRSGDGGPCSDRSQCEPGLECNGTRCYTVCADDRQCGTGAYCEFGECQRLRADGVGCDTDRECISGFCTEAEVCLTKPGIGDPCTSPSDCYPHGFCSGGTCAMRRGPGESCTSIDSCLEPYLCQSSVCTRISLACEPGRVGDGCTYLRYCDETSYCDYSTITCVPRLGEGQGCIATLQNCAPGLYCGASGTCEPQARQGDPCTDSARCIDGTVCTGGTCQPGTSGAPCEQDEECPPGTFCGDDAERCEPFRMRGDPCDEPFDAFCDADLYCDDDDVCSDLPGLGEPCTSREQECARGTWCDIFNGRMCAARAGLGAPCESSPFDNCIEGASCEYDGNSMYVCTMGLPNGERCRDGDECASGSCVGEICSATESCFVP